MPFLCPVSYTHLDVYKRQEYDELCGEVRRYLPKEEVKALREKFLYSVGEQLTVLYSAERVLEVYIAHSDGFYFRAEQFNARLVPLKNKVVVRGFSVGGALKPVSVFFWPLCASFLNVAGVL